MSVYKHDGRVDLRPDGSAVVQSDPPCKVIEGPFRWAIYTGPGMDMVAFGGYGSRDAAIRSLIGEPAVTA